MKQQINAFDYAGHICESMKKGILLTTKVGEKVKTDLTPDGGEISMKYTIDSNLRLISRNSVKISVREVK